MSAQTLRVLGVLSRHQELSGAEIGQAASLPSGTLHPMLARLETSAWVASRWEDGDAAALGRPRRRFYEITDEGRRKAKLAFLELLAAWP